ncbi:basic proline-rich protein-like [Canis lupus dingo]|uniref:basic proline-rich protein-like n=1 Tax=Canis lupus dingo TaxID=286419 RepID=UPI0020C30613|nr:basic proline-rich protein-like [Canis lupus dingo]
MLIRGARGGGPVLLDTSQLPRDRGSIWSESAGRPRGGPWGPPGTFLRARPPRRSRRRLGARTGQARDGWRGRDRGTRPGPGGLRRGPGRAVRTIRGDGPEEAPSAAREEETEAGGLWPRLPPPPPPPPPVQGAREGGGVRKGKFPVKTSRGRRRAGALRGQEPRGSNARGDAPRTGARAPGDAQQRGSGGASPAGAERASSQSASAGLPWPPPPPRCTRTATAASSRPPTLPLSPPTRLPLAAPRRGPGRRGVSGTRRALQTKCLCNKVKPGGTRTKPPGRKRRQEGSWGKQEPRGAGTRRPARRVTPAPSVFAGRLPRGPARGREVDGERPRQPRAGKQTAAGPPWLRERAACSHPGPRAGPRFPGPRQVGGAGGRPGSPPGARRTPDPRRGPAAPPPPPPKSASSSAKFEESLWKLTLQLGRGAAARRAPLSLGPGAPGCPSFAPLSLPAGVRQPRPWGLEEGRGRPPRLSPPSPNSPARPRACFESPATRGAAQGPPGPRPRPPAPLPAPAYGAAGGGERGAGLRPGGPGQPSCAAEA